MAKIVGLPKLSPTMEEGTLAKWAKSEGDIIEIDDLVAEVETDKATMEWRAFDKGVLLKILAQEGDVLQPDQPVAIIGEKGDDISDLLAQMGGGARNASPPPRPDAESKSVEADEEPIAKGDAKEPSGAGESTSGTRAGSDEARERSAATTSVASHEPKPARKSGRVLASPLVRRLALEHDLDLRELEGSGPNGRIVKRDIDEALKRPKRAPESTASIAPAPPKPAKQQNYSIPPPATANRPEPKMQRVSSMRKTIARRLTESKQTVPHFYLAMDVDAQPLWDARIHINKELEKSGEKVSINDVLIKACAVALRRVPAVNASFLGDQLAYHQVVDISVAVAIPDGLVTPVVRDADLKGIVQISREVRELAGRAKEKKLKPEEMTGGTFSISNLGMYGLENFAAVINPPEGAILAVGAVREEPVVYDGAVVPGRRMKMTLSCDHRVVDGAIGAEWLAALKRILEAPITMLM